MLGNSTYSTKHDCQLWRLPKVIEYCSLGRSFNYELMSRGEFPQSFKIADRAVDWIRRKRYSEITSRKIQQYGPRPRLAHNEVIAVLETLSEHGYLVTKFIANSLNPVYRVNPALFVATVAIVARGNA